jgi:hypothetical protein
MLEEEEDHGNHKKGGNAPEGRVERLPVVAS